MPRDGSGVYSPPANTKGSPNTTIESSKYNAFVDDLTADANNARPITAGGTGETAARLKDGTWRFQNTDDATKLLAFDLSGITTATTRTLTVPDASALLYTDATPVSGFRNKIINGDFDIWQRGTSFSGTVEYTADRWRLARAGSTCTITRRPFSSASTLGDPRYYMQAVVGSVTGASNYVQLRQAIEGVRTLADKTVTVTLWAKADAAGKKLSVELAQMFGTGGSPSSTVSHSYAPVTLTTSFARYSFLLTLGSMSGKTIGSNGDDQLRLNIWLDAGSSFNDQNGSLGQQSGTFDIAHISLVEGDATAEADPFSPRHIQQEVALCKRYYEAVGIPSAGLASVGQAYSATNYFWDLPFAEKRAIPSISVPTTLTPLLATGASGVSVSQTPSAVYYNRCRVTGVTSSTLVAGNATAVYASGASTITIDAEL